MQTKGDVVRLPERGAVSPRDFSAFFAEALGAFFGTEAVRFSLDSRVTGTTRTYDRFHEVVKDVNQARVVAGFHFRNSDLEGSILGRKVADYVVNHFFQPLS